MAMRLYFDINVLNKSRMLKNVKGESAVLNKALPWISDVFLKGIQVAIDPLRGMAYFDVKDFRVDVPDKVCEIAVVANGLKKIVIMDAWQGTQRPVQIAYCCYNPHFRAQALLQVNQDGARSLELHYMPGDEEKVDVCQALEMYRKIRQCSVSEYVVTPLDGL